MWLENGFHLVRSEVAAFITSGSGQRCPTVPSKGSDPTFLSLSDSRGSVGEREEGVSAARPAVPPAPSGWWAEMDTEVMLLQAFS